MCLPLAATDAASECSATFGTDFSATIFCDAASNVPTISAALSWNRTWKTSPSTLDTAPNWNVNGLLDRMLLEKKEKGGDTTVGTSTNCSANCGSQSQVRCGMLSSRILRTSISCCEIPGINVSKNWRTPIESQDKLVPGAAVPLQHHLRPLRLSQRGWPHPRWRRSLAPWRMVQLALLHLTDGCGGRLLEEWCLASATAIATAIRSWRGSERKRHSRLRLAAEHPASRAADMATHFGFDHVHKQKGNTLLLSPLDQTGWWG